MKQQFFPPGLALKSFNRFLAFERDSFEFVIKNAQD